MLERELGRARVRLLELAQLLELEIPVARAQLPSCGLLAGAAVERARLQAPEQTELVRYGVSVVAVVVGHEPKTSQ